MQTQRRSFLRKFFGSLAAVTGIGFTANAETNSAEEKEVGNIVYDQEVPLFSGNTKLGNLVFIAGKGAHFQGDIRSHTDHVLKELEKELILAGYFNEESIKSNGISK